MAVRVRVQNFQSIVDATVVIDGFTVVTGPNHSGKTALMRACRGVFTNAPAGPLVRHGTAHLTVTMTFDDGTEIIWEKGWEKPGQKGGTINRYTLNGVALSNVGRGVPPEVSGVGVRDIQASSSRVWPQIAQQFTGTLFLLDKTGAAVAEALSDVERVGKLTSALKLSEKDRRARTSELKIRRKDVKTARVEVEAFDGLNVVAARVGDIDSESIRASYAELKEVHRLGGRYQEASSTAGALAEFDPSVVPGSEGFQAARGLRDDLQAVASLSKRITSAQGELSGLEGFDKSVVPPASEFQAARGLRDDLLVITSLRDRLATAQATAKALAGFDPGTLPETSRPLKIQKLLGFMGGLSDRLNVAKAEHERFAGFTPPEFPDSERAEKISTLLGQLVDLSDRYKKAQDLLRGLDVERESVDLDAAVAAAAIQSALGDRGFCPTCNSVHESETHA